MSLRLRTLALLPPLLLTAAASGQEAASPPQQDTTVAAAALDADRVIDMIVVKVNGTPIFLSELRTELGSQLAFLRTQLPEDAIQAQLTELRSNVLTGMIDDRMMMQRADQLGIVADANMVDRTIQNLKQQNNIATDEEFEAALEAAGLSLEEFREQTRRRIRQQLLASQEIQRDVFVSESEIERYYAANPESFRAPEQVRLEQLVFVGGSELREQAAAALAELRGGATLDEVGGRYPTASAFPAGDSPVNVTDLSEALAAAVPGLPEGSFSDPIQSQFGWHLVRVVERRPETVFALADVRDQIRGRLMSEKSQERLNDYLGQLRAQTYLEILAPEFNDIEAAWRAAGETDEATTTQD